MLFSIGCLVFARAIVCRLLVFCLAVCAKKHSPSEIFGIYFNSVLYYN